MDGTMSGYLGSFLFVFLMQTRVCQRGEAPGQHSRQPRFRDELARVSRLILEGTDSVALTWVPTRWFNTVPPNPHPPLPLPPRMDRAPQVGEVRMPSKIAFDM